MFQYHRESRQVHIINSLADELFCLQGTRNKKVKPLKLATPLGNAHALLYVVDYAVITMVTTRELNHDEELLNYIVVSNYLNSNKPSALWYRFSPL